MGRGGGAVPTLPRCRHQPRRQDGGAVAADRVSPWPKGAAQTESSLLPPSKNAFHFVIVEVIPELWPPTPTPLPPSAKIVTCNRKDLSAMVAWSSALSARGTDSIMLLNTESGGG